MQTRIEIGGRIKRAREDIELSQDDFATAMGRSTRKWTYEIETGKTSLGAEEIRRVARILRKDVSWLLGDSPDDESAEAELILGYRSLPAEGRRWLLGSLRGMLGQADRQE